MIVQRLCQDRIRHLVMRRSGFSAFLQSIVAVTLFVAPLPALAQPAAAEQALEAAPTKRVHTPGDPLEGFNRGMFRIFQAVDKVVFRPLALGYRHVVPRPVRSGLRNFFSNLGEPIVFINDVLQLRPRRAVRTFGRFTFNTVLGVGGLIDVSTHENLPHHDNGFGSTMAFYGVKSGPYVFVPFLGPTTLRDMVGGIGDGMVLPNVVGPPFNKIEYEVPRAVLTGLDQRAEADDELQSLYRTALDPYATLRSVYLQNREAQIVALKAHNRDPVPGGETTDDPLTDPAPPASDTTAPPPRTPSLP